MGTRRLWLCALALALAGCTLFPQQKTENLLASAGFRIVAANTPEKIDALNSLPADKISRVDRNGTTFYVYADRGDCRCLRVGREEQYQRYLKLAGGAKAQTLQVTGVNTDSDNFKGYDPW
ncbi:MAG TPA: hypothetical protein VMR50_05745 [Myxococcota bacterium]|nr:hypothetical protein [Myxococcota bacterium]